jgi:propanediol utilization protein
MEIKIPIEVSARHIHLSKNDLDKLFGEGYELKKKNDLSQSSDFAAEEVLDIEVNGKIIENLRVVGPVREETQIEISLTDAVKLSVEVPLRLSGDVKGSHFVTIIGPNGKVDLTEGLIIAQRHIHCATNDLQKFGLKAGQKVSVKVESGRPITFHDVEIRVKDDYKLCLHLDTDEGNAAGIDKKAEGIIVL